MLRQQSFSLAGLFGAYWGVVGVCLLLIIAVYRLAMIALDAFTFSFYWYHWLLLVCNLGFMAYSEGYRGFQKNFSPRVAARARYLKFRADPNLLHIVFAPLFCMGYFYAVRRRLVTTYGLTISIIILILTFNYISQPWRGILDAGVVVGLTWGVISIIIYFIDAMKMTAFDVSTDVPVIDRGG